MAGTIAESFVGKWLETSVDNFDGYCKAIGLDPALIAAAMKVKVDEVWKVSGDQISYGMHSDLKSSTLTFKLNEEFDEKTPGGRQLRTKYTIEDGKLVKRQLGKPFNCISYMELSKEGQLIEKMVCQSPVPVTAIRIMHRV